MKDKFKTKSVKKMYKRIPGGKTVIHYKKEKPGIQKCAECKKPLHGIPKLSTSKLSGMPKTKKRPQRSYGGYLCSKCSRRKITEKIRGNA